MQVQLLDETSVRFPVAAEALMNVHVHLMVKNRVEEHIQANISGWFHEQNSFQLPQGAIDRSLRGDCIKLPRTQLTGMRSCSPFQKPTPGAVKMPARSQDGIFIGPWMGAVNLEIQSPGPRTPKVEVHVFDAFAPARTGTRLAHLGAQKA